MNVDRPWLSIVIPAYKEAAKINRDVAAANDFISSSNKEGEIIVVDDGSPDDTARTLRSLHLSYPRLRVVSYSRNRGKGHALAQGVSAARGQYILFADAGLCVPYDIATLGLKMLELGMCDIAHGSRRMRGSILKAQPRYRRIGSKIYALVVHLLMGVPHYISDTQCGFKVYRREIAQKLFAEAITDGFMFDVEIILRGLRNGARVLEFPVLWSNDADTRYDPVKGTIRNFRELAKIRWTLATEKSKGEALRKERSARREPVKIT